MSQPILIKAYGSLWPAGPDLARELRGIAALAQPEAAEVDLDGDLLRIAFEGVYFPGDEFAAAIGRNLDQGMRGRLDILDLEAWRLRRLAVANGAISESRAPLNNVLAYSGH